MTDENETVEIEETVEVQEPTVEDEIREAMNPKSEPSEEAVEVETPLVEEPAKIEEPIEPAPQALSGAI